MKRIFAACVVFACLAFSQDTRVISHRSVDVNGHRVADGPDVVQTKAPNSLESTEIMQSVNGRAVPLERREERVLRDDASGRLVETLIRTYDQAGNPSQPVKQVLEEQKRPDGSSTRQVATYRADLNGKMQLIEKSVTDVRKSGSSETSETSLQRPGVNGSLETVEKQTTVTSKQSPSSYQKEAITYQRDGNGNFALAVKQVVEHSQDGGVTTDNAARYEVIDGRLQLHSQTVSKVVTRPDGSRETELNLFAPNTLGTVDSGSQKLKLREQQIVEKRPGPGGSVVETVSVRRPSLTDQTVLGPVKQISETICRGKCEN
ncbi:MAG TPA: hypothetical protein VIX89_10950 [Bryobacteraceae bacterium]